MLTKYDLNKKAIDDELSELEKQYGIARTEQEKAKARAQESAYITLETLKKYLPQHMRETGMNGSGLSETSLVNAYNNYANNLGQIEEGYQTNKTALDKAYTQQKNELTYKSGLNDAERQEAFDAGYDAFAAEIKSYPDEYTFADIDKAYEKGKITKEDSDDLKKLLDKTIMGDIQELINDKEYLLALSELDKAHVAGSIDDSTYKSAFFDTVIKYCSGNLDEETKEQRIKYLQGLLSDKKLTAAEYTIAVNYLKYGVLQSPNIVWEEEKPTSHTSRTSRTPQTHASF